MATSPQTRIAADVWEIARQEKERLGLGSEKEAIESMVRRFNAQPASPPTPQADTHLRVIPTRTDT